MGKTKTIQTVTGSEHVWRTIPEAFALACGKPLETPAEELIGPKALELLKRRAKRWRWQSYKASALLGLAFSAGAFSVTALSVRNGGVWAIISTLGALASVGGAIAIRRKRYEPTLAELLRTAESDDQRRCIHLLEAYRDALAKGETKAHYYDPTPQADKPEGRQVSPAAFGADHGRLLILTNDHAWAVRASPVVQPVPIRVRCVIPAPIAAKWRHWLVGVTADELEQWFEEYCRQARTRDDTKDRRIIVYRYAREVLEAEQVIDRATLDSRVLNGLASRGSNIRFKDETIQRMLGDNNSSSHSYGAFRQFVLNKVATRPGATPAEACAIKPEEEVYAEPISVITE
jgi:hypothetical protein